MFKISILEPCSLKHLGKLSKYKFILPNKSIPNWSDPKTDWNNYKLFVLIVLLEVSPKLEHIFLGYLVNDV